MKNSGNWLLRRITVVVGLSFAICHMLLAGPANAQQPFRDCPQCPEMIVVPAGSFSMGTTAEEAKRENLPEAFAAREVPVHRVTIAQPFAMAATEVTRDHYAAFVAETGWKDGASCYSRTATGARANVDGASWRVPGIPQAGTHPVVCIAYADAVAYVAWLSEKAGHRYRLPSEAEWEYAARAGTTTSWFWGDSRDQACVYANVPNKKSSPADAQPGTVFACEDNFPETAPVASFQPNGFGLYDMMGNVWEWAEDCRHPTYDGAPTDGKAWIVNADCNVRVVRGGGWAASLTAPRAAARSSDPVEYRGIGLGFRVARNM